MKIFSSLLTVAAILLCGSASSTHAANLEDSLKVVGDTNRSGAVDHVEARILVLFPGY